jgi:hypothetical protein
MYKAYITTLKKIEKHPNADRLFITECFGNSVIIGSDMKEGQTVVYFPTDGRLSEEYCEKNNLIGTTDANGNRIGGYFDQRRKVTTIKLRKYPSDGFVAPIETLLYTGVDLKNLKEGMLFDEINGHKVCEKYITQATRSASQKVGKPRNKTFKEIIFYDNFKEHKDTEQLVYYIQNLKKGDVLVLSSKMHGTSQRSAYTQEKKFSKFANVINSLFKREVIKPIISWKYVCGTRRVIIKDLERNTGYYGDKEEFRKVAHNNFLGKLHKGETAYYEVVGWVNSSTPIMNKCSNEKLGSDFIKKYGKETIFSYGCLPGISEVYVYRMSMTNEDGVEIDYDWETVKRRCDEMSIKHVPEYSKFVYDGNSEKLLNVCKELAEGEDPVGKTHIKEGVVIRIDGCKWKAYKFKSTDFKILEGIIKDTDVIDIEEAEDVKEE